MNNFKRAPIYPILFGIYPVIALLAHNVEQVKFMVALRPLAIAFVGTSVFFISLYMLLRNRDKAAAVCTLSVVLFFSYGHVYDFLKQMDSHLSILARHRYLIPIWLVVFGVVLWLFRRWGWKFQSVTPTLNLVAALALVFPVFQIGSFHLRSQQALADRFKTASNIDKLPDLDNQPRPDIYYIILDGYTRDDILREIYHYDNEPFLDRLTEIGFYIARCSQSNYAQTELSMAASFNMDYLGALGDGFDKGSTDRSGLWPLLSHARVRIMLEEFGYKVVAFETGYYWIQWEDADIYLAPLRVGSIDQVFHWEGLNSFEVMLFRSSVARVLEDTEIARDLLERILPDLNYPGKVARDRTLYVLERLEFSRMNEIQGPKFIYAHIITPHSPYVFGPNGEIAENEHEFTYTDQVIYINHRIEKLVEEIISNSVIPPIIILQGDHGLGGIPRERMAILNAYYLPNGGDQMLYPEISPVNTFRVIFDYYFNTELGMLEDKSYFSTYEAPYNYEEVLNIRDGCRSE